MPINIEWQDQNGNWHHYQTKQNQADEPHPSIGVKAESPAPA